MIRDRGKRGHGRKTLPKIEHPGRLEKLGYAVHEDEELRHEALRKAVRKYGKKSVEGSLQIQANYRENEPEYAEQRRKFSEDRHWVSKNT